MAPGDGHSRTLAIGLVLLALACGRVSHAEGEEAPTQASQAGAPVEAGSAAEPGSGGEPAAAMGGAPTAGGGGEANGGQPVEPLLPLLPWQVGNSWTYHIVEDGVVTEKTTTVGPEEPVGGVGPAAERLANLVVTDESNGEHTESWQGPVDLLRERIVRYRERDYEPMTFALATESHYDPYKLHVDGTRERTLEGATWLEEHVNVTMELGVPPREDRAQDRWTVLADDEELTVPAGTFTNVVHLVRQGSIRDKHYWYARGVGKLREEGNQVEELVGYHLEP